ncbi:hypothetical protein [Vibrio phage RYC]|nr:hypothetical protein [Vibrio phage RYC]
MALLIIDSYQSSDWECPHCHAEYEASGCYETDQGDHECDKCGEVFYVDIEWDPVYTVSKEE